MPKPSEPQRNSGARLESWKEIAAYLNRDARTVRRWEQAEGLPVHRHRHLARSSVYAYTDELDTWRNHRRIAPLERGSATGGRKARSLALIAACLIGVATAGDGRLSGPLRATQSTDRTITPRSIHYFVDSISLDGRYSAFSSREDIGIVDVATGEIKYLQLHAATDFALLSPDLSRVAYSAFAERPASLNVVDNKTGAKPRVLVSSPEYEAFVPGAWSPDGTSILVAMRLRDKTWRLSWISVSTGAVTVLKSLGWRFNEDGFSLSPDGRYVAYAAYPVNPPTARPAATEAPDTYIYVVPANDGSREIVVANTSGRNRKPLWTPDGSHIVFTSDRESSVGLWASAVKDGKPFGSATLIKDKIGDIRPIGVTRSGTYYYGVGRHDYKLTTVPFAPRQSDALSADLTAIPGVVYATWSPDGKSLAFVKWGSRGYDLALHPLDTAQERTVVPADGNGWYGGPIWLHDGKSLVVARVGTPVIWGRLDLQSGRFAQIFALEKNEATGGGAASPDDRTLYIPRRRVQAGSWTESIVARDLTTDAERRIMTISGVADRAAETPDAHDLNIGRVLLSPDGRQLVYTRVVANERNWHLGIVGVDGRDARELYAPPVNSWVDLVGWTPDAQWILFEQDSMIMRVPAAGGAAEPTGIAVPGERQQSKPTPSLFLSPDGTRLAIRYSGWVGETWAIDNIGALVSRNQQ